MHKISLVIPSLNAEATIERAIQSVARQQYPALELILADGASSDRTMERVEKYRSLFSRIISEPDRGQADALNKAFQLASGDVFGYLCADDELAPDALHRVDRLFGDNPQTGLVTGGSRRFFPDGTQVEVIPSPAMLRKLAYLNPIEQPSTFWKASYHRRAGALDDRFHFAFDYEWWNRLRACGASMVITPHILSHFHFSLNNKTSCGGTRLVNEMYRVVKRYGPYKGRLADIYMLLYRHFDLHGCIDGLTPSSRVRKLIARLTWKLLLRLLNPDYIRSYNWNFASKQERGIVWWR